jgi:hypothetical protein
MTRQESAADARAAMVDELGDLENETRPYKAKLARIEVLRKALRAPFSDQDPMKSFTVDGTRWRVVLGPAGNQSYVDSSALLKLIGSAKFAEVAKVSLEALASVPGDIVAAVTRSAQTGARKIDLLLLSAIRRRAS